MDYAMNTTVSVVMPVATKVRLIEEAQKRTIENRSNVTVSDLIRAGIEELLRVAEQKNGSGK